MEINLPKLGESILSATVVQWFKKVGDSVALDEPLLEVSTDKVIAKFPHLLLEFFKKSMLRSMKRSRWGENSHLLGEMFLIPQSK